SPAPGAGAEGGKTSIHRGARGLHGAMAQGTGSGAVESAGDVPEAGARRVALSRGRDAEAPPAQIPACSFPAPGSSVTLASALSNSDKHHLPMSTLRDPGLLQGKSLQQGAKPLPGHPALLTPPPQPLLQQ